MFNLPESTLSEQSEQVPAVSVSPRLSKKKKSQQLTQMQALKEAQGKIGIYHRDHLNNVGISLRERKLQDQQRMQDMNTSSQNDSMAGLGAFKKHRASQ